MAHSKRLIIYLSAFGFICICLLNIPESSIADDTIIYGANAYGRADMIEINLTQMSSRQVGDVLFDTQAIGQDPETGLVYYFEWQSSGNELAYWDPETRTNTPVKTYASTPWGWAKRAAFGPDGLLYLMDDVNELYTIDTDTGDWIYIGQAEGIQTGSFATGDMAFGPDGTLYVVTSENLYSIDIETEPLVATLLDTNMIPGGGWRVWTGLAFCNETLYASDVIIFRNISAVYRIDLLGDDQGTAVTQLFSTGTMINDLTSCPAITGDGNLPPVLDPIGDQVVKVGDILEFTVTATDPNVDDNLTCTASVLPDSVLPDGVTFGPVDPGSWEWEFSWTPSADQEGDYEIEFTVTDEGGLDDSETITITVGNLPPVLNPIGDKTIEEGNLLEFTLTATDPNVDDNLTCTASVLPDGVTFGPVDPGSWEWEFSWTPSADQEGDYEIEFTVTDEGGLDDSETITITVTPEEPKSFCGAAPMYRDGGRTNLSAVNSCGNALLPLLPPLVALGLWCVYRAGRRRKNR